MRPEAVAARLTEGHLVSLQWLADGRDVELVVALAGGGQARVLCTAVTGLDLDLHYRKNAGGAPHAFACEIERTLHARWSLHWSFPPHGVVALECADVRVSDDACVADVTDAPA